MRIRRENPKGGDGQQCTLKLPPGIALARGESAAKPVRTEPGKDYAVVAWRVVPSEVKSYTLEALLDNGANDKATAEVLEDTIWGRSR